MSGVFSSDYDATTGRYLKADPLGLIEGASVYGYALQNPGRWVDPRGDQAIPLPGSGPMGPIGLVAPGTPLGDALGNSLLNLVRPSPALPHENPMTAQKKVEKARERKSYKTFCSKPPLPTSGDACKDAKAKLDHARQCLSMRESFSKKWFGDNEPRHAYEAQSWANRIRHLEDFMQINCPQYCDPVP